MKKLYICIFIFVFVFVFILAMQVSASDKISDNEVVDLIKRAVELFETTYNGISKDIDPGYGPQVAYRVSDYINTEGQPITIDRNGRLLTYLPAIDEYYDYSVWEDYASSIYSDDLYPYAIEHGKGSDQVLGLLVNHQGKAYFLSDADLGWTSLSPFWPFSELKVGEEDSPIWQDSELLLETNANGQARADFKILLKEEKDQGGPLTLHLSVDFSKTNKGWRISGGSLVDIFCPMHKGEREERPERYVQYYPLLYPQIAKIEIPKALQNYYNKPISLNSLRIRISGCNYEPFTDEEGRPAWSHEGTNWAAVEISSSDLFGNIPFEVHLISDYLHENWQLVSIDTRHIENPITADDSEALLFIIVFLFLGLKLWHFNFKSSFVHTNGSLDSCRFDYTPKESITVCELISAPSRVWHTHRYHISALEIRKLSQKLSH